MSEADPSHPNSLASSQSAEMSFDETLEALLPMSGHRVAVSLGPETLGGETFFSFEGQLPAPEEFGVSGGEVDAFEFSFKEADAFFKLERGFFIGATGDETELTIDMADAILVVSRLDVERPGR